MFVQLELILINHVVRRKHMHITTMHVQENADNFMSVFFIEDAYTSQKHAKLSQCHNKHHFLV